MKRLSMLPGFRIAALAAVVILSAAIGCGGREYGWEKEGEAGPAKQKTSPADAAGIAEAERKANEAWKKRDEMPPLREAIGHLKKVLELKGGADYKTLVWLSRAHYILGEITPEEDTEKRLEAYDAGTRYGDLALNTIPEFRKRFEQTKSVEESVEAVGKEGIDAIYWDAVNLGKWSKAKGVTKALFIKDKVKRMYERVLQVDDRWWWGAAHRSLGAFYSALPSFAGRDLDRSRDHFEKAKKIEDRYFATRVLYADYYARAANDRKLYKSELEFVLKAPADAIPEIAPEQRIEQRKAKKLLDEIDDYFDAEEGSE